MTEKLTSQQLKSFLWDAANILRGKIDSGDFKHYILGLLFYKRLSDVFDEEFAKMKDTVGEKLAITLWNNMLSPIAGVYAGHTHYV